MSGSRWVIIPSWLSVSLRSFFVQFFCVFLPSLLNICFLLLGPYCFCPLLCPSLHEIFPRCLSFSWTSPVFLILLFSSISLHCSPWYMGINSWSTLHRVVVRKPKFWFWAARCRGGQLGEGTKVKIRTKTLFIYYNLVGRKAKQEAGMLHFPLDWYQAVSAWWHSTSGVILSQPRSLEWKSPDVLGTQGAWWLEWGKG